MSKITKEQANKPTSAQVEEFDLLQDLELLYDIILTSRINQFKKGFARGYYENIKQALTHTPSTPTEEDKTKVFVSYFYTLGNRASGQGSLVFENVDIIEDYVHIEQLSNKIDEKLNKQYDCEDSKSVVTNFKILRKRVE